jgi:hypothetical protein
MLGALRSNIQVMRSGSNLTLIGFALAFALATNMVGWFADDSGFLGPHASYVLWLFVGLSEVSVRISQTTTPSRVA